MAPTRPASSRFRFVNLDGSEPHPLSAVLKWAVLDRATGRRRSVPPGNPAPSISPDLQSLQRAPGPGEPARLTWIGHASWLIQLDGVSLLIDPILSESIGPGVSRFVHPQVIRRTSSAMAGEAGHRRIRTVDRHEQRVLRRESVMVVPSDRPRPDQFRRRSVRFRSTKPGSECVPGPRHR